MYCGLIIEETKINVVVQTSNDTYKGRCLDLSWEIDFSKSNNVPFVISRWC